MKNKNILLLLFLVLITASCSNELDKILPKDQIPQEELTPEDIEKVLNGVYAKMEDFVFKFWFDHDLRGDNY
ncbi:MAG: RagB/SusD family nutrient uptake outer membrane protein, partial [Prevotellaceae bacterium]|nr:RagB/SusD family nutrient uptake outer membrane protein [Prevotellaceae bacterium]